MSTVRLGIIGVGLRGQSHLVGFLKRSDVDVVAMADPDKNRLAMAQKLVAQYNKKAPLEFTNGNYDYRNLVKRDDIDAVLIASPWEWHSEQALAAVNAGKKALGHGGKEFFADNNFIECLKRHAAFPLDVYDLATWYAITPLTEKWTLTGEINTFGWE
jgi:hypothetical protein